MHGGINLSAESRARASDREAFPECRYLMHALVKDRHDADSAMAEYFPVNKMFLVPAKVSGHAKLCGHRAPQNASLGDGLE